jgi:polar amino acid transport system substrate-binding protein
MLRFVILAGALLLPASAHAQAPALVTPGTFTWGVSETFPPFESVVDGKPIGFDVDLAQALGSRMGLISAPTAFDFSGLIAALLAHRIDAIISGMYVNPQREQVADFVVYMLIGNQIVVRHGNPLKLSDLASLCGHTVAAPVGTVFETQANAAQADCKNAGHPELTVLALPGGTTAAALALSQGRADAIIVSSPTMVALEQQRPDDYDAAGPPLDNSTRVGIAVAKNNPALTNALRQALAAIVADGSYARLLSKWGFPPQSSAFP